MISKKVITYGTFDLFHIGHLYLLQRAKSLGNHLTVGVSTDYFNEAKNKQTHVPFEHRKLIVENIKCVDRVIPEFSWDQKINDIKSHEIDLFVMGSDWKGEFDFIKEYCEVIYLPRTENISSTDIKKEIGTV